MANIPLYYDRATWLFLLDEVVAEAEEKADEAVEAVDEAKEMAATSATYSFSIVLRLFFCRKISWLLVGNAGAPVVVTV